MKILVTLMLSVLLLVGCGHQPTFNNEKNPFVVHSIIKESKTLWYYESNGNAMGLPPFMVNAGFYGPAGLFQVNDTALFTISP